MLKSRRRAALAAALFLPLSALPPTAALAFALSPASAPAPQASTPLPAGFTSATAQVNGTTLHYVRGGKGPVVVLVHGFPEDWSEFRAIMPRLTQRFTVVAPDLRGIGGSAAASGGYDAANRAKDIHDLATALKLDHLYLVGHDLGGITAYAYLRRYPQTLRGAMILDTPIPGVDGWDEAMGGPLVWHVGFMQVPGLAEQMVPGRQSAYLGYFYDLGKFTPAERAERLRAYASPAQLRAVFAMYRAFPADVKFNAAQTAPNAVPLVYATGDHSPFAKFVPKVAQGLRAKGLSHVETAAIPGAVHYLVADRPADVAALIERHAGQ
jgi:pimeloyl-ACP methyl ester carboxylesterase